MFETFPPVLDRAYQLTDRYLCKAQTNNPLVKELLDSYKTSAELDDGAHVKPKSRRTTILGTVAANQGLKCNQLSLPPPEPQETQQDSINSSEKSLQPDAPLMGLKGMQISRSSPILEPGDPGAIV